MGYIARLVLSVTTTMVVGFGVAESAIAAGLWSWSFGAESGTFTTFEDGPGLGTYTIEDFEVLSSSQGAPVGSLSGGDWTDSFTITGVDYANPSFVWDGSAPDFSGSSGGFSVSGFLSSDEVYFYLFDWLTEEKASLYSPDGFGGFNLLEDASYVVAYSGTQPNPIPTPALLPGLIGFGAATLRKRKQDQASHCA